MTEIAEVSGEGTVDKLVYRRGVSVRPYGLVILLLLIFPTPSQAQIQVDVAFKRSLYMLYEPLICAVTITNLTGNTLSLADTPREKWFGFQIETVDGRPLPPIDSTRIGPSWSSSWIATF